MALIDDLLNYYRELIAQMRADIKEMEAGHWTLHDLRNGKREDITAEHIKELERRIKQLEDIIAAYEKRDA